MKISPEIVAQARVILTMGDDYALSNPGRVMAAIVAFWLAEGAITVINSKEKSLKIIQTKTTVSTET